MLLIKLQSDSNKISRPIIILKEINYADMLTVKYKIHKAINNVKLQKNYIK